jgi:hypothetical protein
LNATIWSFAAQIVSVRPCSGSPNGRLTAEAVGVLTPRERDALFVQYVNHAPQASILADKADVVWGGESSIAAAIKTLDRRGARADRIATLGANDGGPTRHAVGQNLESSRASIGTTSAYGK